MPLTAFWAAKVKTRTGYGRLGLCPYLRAIDAVEIVAPCLTDATTAIDAKIAIFHF